MLLEQLVVRLKEMQPEAAPQDIARLALLVTLHVPNLSELDDAGVLEKATREVNLQMQASTDQHAAVAEELDALASTQPSEFAPDHLWTLLRAIKVQSQILQMYLGPEASQSPI